MLKETEQHAQHVQACSGLHPNSHEMLTKCKSISKSFIYLDKQTRIVNKLSHRNAINIVELSWKDKHFGDPCYCKKTLF